MQKISRFLVILLCLLLVLPVAGCGGKNKNDEEGEITDLTKLTKDELNVYDEYLFSYKDRDLKGLSPLSICKFYLLSQTREYDDRETMWNLLSEETAPPNSQDYIKADPEDEIVQYIDEELYTDVEDVREEFIDDNTVLVKWKAVKDGKTYAIKLFKVTDKLTGEEAWKIIYPPLIKE
ncbi:MAG TPA: hypothetical protein GXZ53_02580 [Firmicutes bacterium]|nr:hypothetical protein [Bacillota bacterium]